MQLEKYEPGTSLDQEAHAEHIRFSKNRALELVEQGDLPGGGYEYDSGYGETACEYGSNDYEFSSFWCAHEANAKKRARLD